MFVPAVIIGAGHAGLAMSHRLTERSIDHVVLERGEVANSWRTERWESLRLLTPNWHARLPGHRYDGDDPDGYMSVREVTDLIADYARTIAAPVQSGTTVTRVTALADGYEVTTDRGVWRCAAVVIATGACSVAVVPPIAAGLPDRSRVRDPADVSQRRRSGRRRRAGRRGVGHRGPARRGDPPQRSPRHARRRRTRQNAQDLPRPRHLLVDRRAPASSTSGTTPSTTSSAPAISRRPNSSAPRSGARSISTRCGISGSGSSVGSAGSATASPSSPDRCPTPARWPTSR